MNTVAAYRADSPLLRRICADDMGVVAVLGMTKNTGKTVTLNHLLEAAWQQRMAVGLTSIGRDGEERDAVFSNPKPPVRVWPGMLVATAKDTLLRAGVRTKLLAPTGVHSPMGEVVLVKVLEPGTMEVAGASRSHDQQRVIGQMRQCGASLMLVDGALGRSQHASPAMADGVVLATGAALGGGLSDVLRKTRERLLQLGLAQVDPLTRSQLGNFFDQPGVGLWDTHGVPIWRASVASLNAAPLLLEAVRQTSGAIGMLALTGAVGRRLWVALEAVAQQHPGLRIVVADGTRLFVEGADLQSLQRKGGCLLAWRAIRLVGLTVNPFSPLGGHLDAAALLQAARSEFPELVVCDVVHEEQLSQKELHHGPFGA